MVYGKLQLQSKTHTSGLPFSGSLSAYEEAMCQFSSSLTGRNMFTSLDRGLDMNKSHSGIKGSKNKLLDTENLCNDKEDEDQNLGPTVGDGLKKTHSYYKGYFSPESFGSYEEVMAALEKPVSSYSLIYEHPSVQKSFTLPKDLVQKKSLSRSKKNLGVRSNNAIVKATPEKLKSASKKDVRKENKFPQNVRSLMMTGMLDGVPVRYVQASHEKLRGVIKGGDYLCGCESCNYSKTFNAYDFESHAGCKTNHPNNHIRFENGKTIHEIVKKLQGTREDMLADAILTATGSPINQSAFISWKESFEAATGKIQHTKMLTYGGNWTPTPV